MVLKSRLIASMALSLSTLAHGSNIGPGLMDAAAEMQTDVRQIASTIESQGGKGAVIRQFSRADGVQLFTILPPFKRQVTAESIASVDRFSELAFARINAQLGKQVASVKRFQGFSTHQYTDGSSGIIYAALVPVERFASGFKGAGAKSLCDDVTEPAPPRHYPRNEVDTYSEGYANSDSNGIWYQYEWRFEAMACPAGSCGTSSPTGYVWTTDFQCSPVDPQPNPLPPEPPVPPPGNGTGGVSPWDIRPTLIPGNAGFSWTFTCTYAGVPVDCFTG